MPLGRPDTAAQVEDRMKADIQREAPDSNPYLDVHWLRSLVAAIARRQFDFYQDLGRTESRLFPDTADEETSLIWGNIYIGPPNAASNASGFAIATGTAGSTISPGALLSANGNDYTVITGATITANSISVASITRSGTTATVTTASDHNLASAVPVTIAGADQAEYNLTNTEIVVTGSNTFTYQVTGSPASPATGTITATYTSAAVEIESDQFGSDVNLTLDSPITLQSPIAGVNDTLNVGFGGIEGGTDAESVDDYVARYLDKIRNPVAHFNSADIIAKAKEVPGVTRVFVEGANTEIGTVAISSITRSGNVATVTTATAHGLDNGQSTNISGANETEYNVNGARILVESATVFHYIVTGTPTTPATGSPVATTSISIGQVRILFMRDNDPDPIPSPPEVTAVANIIDTIRPATTSPNDVIVKAPTEVQVDYTFTSIVPDTSTMRAAIEAKLAQFHEEQTTVSVSIDEDAYRAAIKSTVDPSTGDTVDNFVLSAPSGDITINSGEIGTLGTVTFP